MKNAPDNDLVFEPKSADYLNKQERQSDVLISTIERYEMLEKKLEIAVNALNIIKQAIEFSFPKRGIKIDTPYTMLLRAVEEKAQEVIAKIKEIK